MAQDQIDANSGFFEKNYDRIYGYVRGMVKDSNEAEALTQEAFLRAQRERDTVKDPGAMLSGSIESQPMFLSIGCASGPTSQPENPRLIWP